MMPLPTSVFPAGGRTQPAAAGQPPSGADSGFAALLDGAPAGPEGTLPDAVAVPDDLLPEAELVVEDEETTATLLMPEQADMPPPMAVRGAPLAGPNSDGSAGEITADGARGQTPRLSPDSLPASERPVGAGHALPLDQAEGEAEVTVQSRPALPAGEPAPVAASPAPAQVITARGEAPAAPSPTTPPPVTRQVAEAILTIKGDSTEIVLNPPELGTVRIVIARDAQGLLVTLSAERPEALDLLRRHADQLRQDLARQGDDAARLDFQTGGQGEGRGQTDGRSLQMADAGLAGRPDIVPAAPDPILRPVTVPGRIDMRI